MTQRQWDDAIEAEHRALEAEQAQLEREHAHLQDHPDDLPGIVSTG